MQFTKEEKEIIVESLFNSEEVNAALQFQKGLKKLEIIDRIQQEEKPQEVRK